MPPSGVHAAIGTAQARAGGSRRRARARSFRQWTSKAANTASIASAVTSVAVCGPITMALRDAERYLARDDVDPLRDGASYGLAAMWLDDAELAAFSRELLTVVQPRLANAPRAGRTRRILATVLLPADEAAAG